MTTLEQLSAAATEGEWSITGLEQSTQIWAETYVGETRDYNGNDADFIVALVNAFRTGQLVAVVDDAIERVKAEARDKALDEAASELERLDGFGEWWDAAQAIRALKSPKPQEATMSEGVGG